MYHLVNAMCLLVNIPFIVSWIVTGHSCWVNLIAAVVIVGCWVVTWQLSHANRRMEAEILRYDR